MCRTVRVLGAQISTSQPVLYALSNPKINPLRNSSKTLSECMFMLTEIRWTVRALKA